VAIDVPDPLSSIPDAIYDGERIRGFYADGVVLTEKQ
jgi:hypothetical protein